jgi:hypothetical protein
VIKDVERQQHSVDPTTHDLHDSQEPETPRDRYAMMEIHHSCPGRATRRSLVSSSMWAQVFLAQKLLVQDFLTQDLLTQDFLTQDFPVARCISDET